MKKIHRQKKYIGNIAIAEIYYLHQKKQIKLLQSIFQSQYEQY